MVTISASSFCELSCATYIALVAFQHIHFLQQLQLSLLIKIYMTPSLNSRVTAAATTMAVAMWPLNATATTLIGWQTKQLSNPMLPENGSNN